jgi:hypothetical protein
MNMTPYHQRVSDQLVKWIGGKPVHNTVDNECTPDFSCCVSGCFINDKAARLEIYNSWARRHGYKKING